MCDIIFFKNIYCKLRILEVLEVLSVEIRIIPRNAQNLCVTEVAKR